jgi:hypothetical protein
LPSSILIGISSPYSRSGLLYKRFSEHYGKNSPNVLVIKAPTRALNPSIDQAIIDEAMAEDPAAARAEWMAEFRSDIASFLTREAIEAVVERGVFERPRSPGQKYLAFVDPSGGISDSMTMAIGHNEPSADRKQQIAVVDAVREIRAPFSPDAAVGEFCRLLKTYGVSSVTGDKYAGEFPREAFRNAGIAYETSTLSKSDIYRDFLPSLNSGQIDLPDNPRMIAQFINLERRTSRGGRDSIDHPTGAHDDIANSVAGVVVMLRSASNVQKTRLAHVDYMGR